jgi:hypothetical protein
MIDRLIYQAEILKLKATATGYAAKTSTPAQRAPTANALANKATPGRTARTRHFARLA